jgi:hypothetical protein
LGDLGGTIGMNQKNIRERENYWETNGAILFPIVVVF